MAASGLKMLDVSPAPLWPHPHLGYALMTNRSFTGLGAFVRTLPKAFAATAKAQKVRHAGSGLS